MFTKYAISIVSLLIIAQPAFAAWPSQSSTSSPEKLCRREFANDLIKCVITSFFQKPKVRAANLKTCVVAAKQEKVACLEPSGGPNQCEVACQATYDGDVASCQATYDPLACGGNAGCEALFIQERTNCISQATDALGSCTQGCQ